MPNVPFVPSPAGPDEIPADVALRALRHALPEPSPLIHDPLRLPREFAVVVIGDARVDVRTSLAGRQFADLRDDYHEQVRVRTSLGGTAVNFAAAAIEHFQDVHVIAALGEDAWTDVIRQQLTGAGIDACFSYVPQPNGSVVIVRDPGTPTKPDGVRLVLAETPSPYDRLDADLVRANEGRIRAADALVVDGYALLSPPSAEAVEVAAGIANSAGVPVCFDVVPHHIDQLLGLASLVPVLSRCSLVVCEAETLLRLLGRPAPERIDADLVRGLVGELCDELSGPHRTWFVRYGIGRTDETTAVSSGHHCVSYETGYAAAIDKSGYGYRIAAAELKWWLANYVRAVTVYPDLAAENRLVGPARFVQHAS